MEAGSCKKLYRCCCCILLHPHQKAVVVSLPYFVETRHGLVSVLWNCCQTLGSLCTSAEQKYGDRAMEKEVMALFLCQAKREHSRLMPQELHFPPWRIGRGYVVRQGCVIRIKAVNSLYSSFFCRASKVWGC